MNRHRLALVALALALCAPRIGAAKPDARQPVIGGEKFVERDIVDQAQHGMIASRMFAPEKWQLHSSVTWNYAWFDNPVAVSIQLENRATAEAFDFYPAARLEYLEVPPQLQRYAKPAQPGQDMGNGAIYLAPLSPTKALELYVKRIRASEPNVHLIGEKTLPDLPKALGLADAPHAQGVALKIGYDRGGKPVEEAFFAVYFLDTVHGAGPAAAIKQTNWGLMRIHSARAPAGQLDKRMVVFAAIAKSVVADPAWEQRAHAIQAVLRDGIQKKIQQGYAQLDAAKRIAQEAMANEAAFDKSLAQQTAYLRDNPARSSSDGGGGTAPGRSNEDRADDVIRGVDTTDDPFWGQSQHSNLEQYHWTDGYGNYVNTNDASYHPSQDKSGDWQLMPDSK